MNNFVELRSLPKEIARNASSGGSAMRTISSGMPHASSKTRPTAPNRKQNLRREDTAVEISAAAETLFLGVVSSTARHFALFGADAITTQMFANYRRLDIETFTHTI